MKNKFTLPLAITLLLFAGRINAQTVSASVDGKEITVFKDTIAQYTLFTGKYCEGKTYLHWEMKFQKENGIYFIYKSSDEGEYEFLGYKKGIGVPIVSPIAYYFQDENPNEGTTSYMVIHIGKNKTYLTSEIIGVTKPRMFLSKIK